MGYKLLIDGIYWGYNPLILTFDPNFQRDIQVVVFGCFGGMKYYQVGDYFINHEIRILSLNNQHTLPETKIALENNHDFFGDTSEPLSFKVFFRDIPTPVDVNKPS